MKTLIFGAGGLLGRHLVAEWQRHNLEVTGLTHAECDITDAERLDEVFARPWDVVINAAAICNFDACEREPSRTASVNRDAPLELARRCAASGAHFVQFSSDYVLRGDRDVLWTENDPPDPLSVYGHHKAELECSVPRLCPHSLVIRISWLYGLEGSTFLSLLPLLLLREETVRVAAGKTGRCLYAPDAAHWVRLLAMGGHTGLFHLANAGTMSWEKFAARCLERWPAHGLQPSCRQLIEVPYESLGPDWTKRPHHSALALDKIAALRPPGPRDWTLALDDYLSELKSVAVVPRV
jgi:dTDP-4-dehydrorhamnose reductase